MDRALGVSEYGQKLSSQDRWLFAVLVGVGRSICTAVHEALDQAELKKEAVKASCRPCDVKRCMQLLLEIATKGAAQQQLRKQQAQAPQQRQQGRWQQPGSLHSEAACAAARKPSSGGATADCMDS